VISPSLVKNHVTELRDIFERQPATKAEDLRMLQRLFIEVLHIESEGLRQQTLDSYFTR
jgi:hypothetical protein